MLQSGVREIAPDLAGHMDHQPSESDMRPTVAPPRRGKRSVRLVRRWALERLEQGLSIEEIAELTADEFPWLTESTLRYWAEQHGRDLSDAAAKRGEASQPRKRSRKNSDRIRSQALTMLEQQIVEAGLHSEE